jgi:peptide/nickel transport system substrate-binding protein
MKNRIKILGMAFVLSMFALQFTFSQTVMGSEESKSKKPYEDYDYLGKPVRGGEFIIASSVDVGLLNPHHWPVMNWDTIDMMYEQVIAAGEHAKMYPWMVDSWEFPDNMTCLMKFKQGIKFHDGSSFNAKNFKYNLEWVMDKKNGCWDRSYLESLKSIEVIDEYTLRFGFKKPFGTFLSTLGYPPGYAISVNALKGDVALREIKKLQTKLKTTRKKVVKLEKKAKKATKGGEEKARKAKKKLEKAKKDLTKLEELYSKAARETEGMKKTDSYPVGTGPYTYDDRSSGNWIKLKRNPDYWYGNAVGRPDMPWFDSVKYVVIPDKSVQLANLKAGKIHLMWLSAAQYNMLRQKPHPSINIDAYNMPHTYMLALNHAKGPCKDIFVRKAISHALDRQALIRGALFGLARPASCIYPNDQWSHNPNLKPVAYDPEKSRGLLREGGYAKGLSMRGFSFKSPESVTIAEAIKSMLKEVGIDWKVDALDITAMDDRWKNLEYDMAFTRWSYIFDPDMPATGWYHPKGGFNFGRSKNEQAISLIEQGRGEIDTNKRQKIYWEIEKILYDNYEDAWLWYSRTSRAYRKNVMGFDAKNQEKYQDLWKRAHYQVYWWFKDGKP